MFLLGNEQCFQLSQKCLSMAGSNPRSSNIMFINYKVRFKDRTPLPTKSKIQFNSLFLVDGFWLILDRPHAHPREKTRKLSID